MICEKCGRDCAEGSDLCIPCNNDRIRKLARIQAKEDQRKRDAEKESRRKEAARLRQEKPPLSRPAVFVERRTTTVADLILRGESEDRRLVEKHEQEACIRIAGVVGRIFGDLEWSALRKIIREFCDDTRRDADEVMHESVSRFQDMLWRWCNGKHGTPTSETSEVQ